MDSIMKMKTLKLTTKVCVSSLTEFIHTCLNELNSREITDSGTTTFMQTPKGELVDLRKMYVG